MYFGLYCVACFCKMIYMIFFKVEAWKGFCAADVFTIGSGQGTPKADAILQHCCLQAFFEAHGWEWNWYSKMQ